MPASRVQPTQPTQPAEYSEFEAQIDRIDAEIFYFETLLQQSRYSLEKPSAKYLPFALYLLLTTICIVYQLHPCFLLLTNICIVN